MEKHLHGEESITGVLREAGFRATGSRVELLSLLAKIGTPLSVQKIAELWKGKPPDITTLYRSLTDLSSAGIVRRIDLNTGIAHFEYTPNRPHHHHIVCRMCGKIEELTHCAIGGLEKKILKESAHFKSIHTHSLEFFGQCTACTQ